MNSIIIIKKYLALALSILAAVSLCGCLEQNATPKPVEIATLSPAVILKDFTTFYKYLYNVNFCKPYTTVNDSLKPLAKDSFYNLLATGKYLPLQLNKNEESETFQAYRMPDSLKYDWKQTLRDWGYTANEHFRLEGKPLPNFEWKNLQGNVITNQTIKGKVIVLKCWFIHCKACVAEFPDLNKIVAKYKDRNDIVFISLALDSAQKLNEFLKNQTFNYQTVPLQQRFMEVVLNVKAYPTHVIVNKKGLISKVINNEKKLAIALETEFAKF